jgi:hypothetical protein
VQTLYYDEASFALERKRIRAAEISRWEPQVRGSYPWASWLNGDLWPIRQGIDYDSSHRLWEAGRKAARSAGVHLTIVDFGGSMTVRAQPGSGTSRQRASSNPETL